MSEENVTERTTTTEKMGEPAEKADTNDKDNAEQVAEKIADNLEKDLGR